MTKLYFVKESEQYSGIYRYWFGFFDATQLLVWYYHGNFGVGYSSATVSRYPVQCANIGELEKEIDGMLTEAIKENYAGVTELESIFAVPNIQAHLTECEL